MMVDLELMGRPEELGPRQMMIGWLVD
jgi:hypothetical protein